MELRSWLSLSGLLTMLTVYYVGHMVNTFYKIYSVPRCASTHMCLKAMVPVGSDGRYSAVQFRVYSSAFSDSLGKIVKAVNDFQLTDPREIELNFNIPLATQRNGSLYMSFFFLPKDFGDDDPQRAKWSVHQRTLISAYREPEQTFNLMKGEGKKNQQKVPGVFRGRRTFWVTVTEGAKKILSPVTHIRSVLNIMSVENAPDLWIKELPEILTLLRWENGVYYPILYVAELLDREKDLVELKPGNKTANITIVYHPAPLGKIRFHRMISSSLAQLAELGFSRKDLEDVKGIFADTNLYLLGVTVFVSSVHLLFDVLSFKNDVAFWRTRKSMVGLSTKALLWRCFSYTVIFFYLKDQETSLLVIVPAGVSVGIEFWKLKKALKVSFSRQGLQFGTHSAEEVETGAFDNEAMIYLAWIMTPLCIGGAIYSLMYIPYKSWYSWVVESLANGVYAFGFLFMLPQLFVNYKLKSVAHLPWRAFMYKAFNTFIDDFFAFIIVMPTAHRVACFRDDIVFIVYLYQRYLYPVDYSRINELGETSEKQQHSTEKPKEGILPANVVLTSRRKKLLRKID